MNAVYDYFDNNYFLFGENIIVPLYDLVKNTSRIEKKKYLNKTQWLSKDKIIEIQNKNLRSLILDAYENVPYYHRLFKEKEIDPNIIKNMDDVEAIPILTKDDIQANAEELVSRRFDLKNLIPYRSGGSTGKQLRFYQHKEQLSWELGAELRAFEWAGYRFGDKCLMFWGSHMDLNKLDNEFKNYLKKMERVRITDTYVMSENIMDRYVNLINEYKPRIIRSYASSVYMVSQYILENSLTVHHPVSVITSAESLDDKMRSTIEEAFESTVYDYYGSREISSLASECEKHEGYHVAAENVAVEIIKDDERASPGEEGMIIVTNLRNHCMPFIRYMIGDMGSYSEETCSCGRGLPLLSSVSGRISDFLAVKDKETGKINRVGPVYPVIITALMEVPVKTCRMIQIDYDKVVFQIVKEKEYTDHHSDFLIEYFKRFFGEDIKVEIVFVDDIPPLPSGKRSAFISRIETS